MLAILIKDALTVTKKINNNNNNNYINFNN